MKTESSTKTYICIVCGFIYDEAVGRVEDGIAAGTKFADIPDSWACPDCGVSKADFEVIEL
jgi:rubredoxin